MKSTIIAGIAALALSSFAFATDAKLHSVQPNGSGCPVQDGKTVPYGFDGQWLTLEVNQAYAVNVYKGKGISLEDGRKNCSFIVDLETPGYRYAIDRVVTTGSYQLDANDQLVSTFDGSFQGDGDTASTSITTNGPAKADYELNSYPKLNWSDCSPDRVATLNTAVRVQSKANNKGSWSTASLGRVAFHIVYQKCN